MRRSFLRPRSLALLMVASIATLLLQPVPSAYAATTVVNNEASCLSIGATEFTSGSCRFYNPEVFNVAAADTVQLAVLTFSAVATNNGTIDVLGSGRWWTFFTTVNNGAITIASGAELDHIQDSFTNNGSISVASGARLIIEDAFTNNGTITVACGGSLTVTNAGTFSGAPPTFQSCPTANTDRYSTNKNTALTVAAPGVLANDTDPEGDPLTAIKVTDPAHGTLTLNSNGSFSYTPAAGYSGSDSFTYRATDGSSSSSPATVTITVVDPAPTAAGDSYTTNEDTNLSVAAPGVLANDTDADLDTLTAVKVTDPAHGTLNLNANGSFVYTPASNYNGSDAFTYRASDGTLTSTAVTVSLTVNPVNDAPTAANDSYTAAEDTPLTVAAPGVLGNDSDVDGDALTVTVTANPTHGTLTLNANGSFTYTPALNYNGSDSFRYTVSDGNGGTANATASITVMPVNDAPTLTVAAGGSCVSDTGGRIPLTVGDVDSNNLTLSGLSSNGAVVPLTNVTFGGSGTSRTATITTVSGRTGAAIITVQVTDGQLTTTTAVTVTAGGNGNDVLTGTNTTDLLLGQNGNDILNGAGGKDVVCGGNGDDRLTGGADADTFDGGKGTDTATDYTTSQGDTQANLP